MGIFTNKNQKVNSFIANGQTDLNPGYKFMFSVPSKKKKIGSWGVSWATTTENFKKCRKTGKTQGYIVFQLKVVGDNLHKINLV